MKKALVDADLVLYRSAFAAERAKYMLHFNFDREHYSFDTKKELDAYVKAHNLSDDFTIEKTRVIEPLENALGNTKEVLEKILSTLETKDCQLFLTGSGNFRRQIPSYKANRDPSMKPYWIGEIMEYMKKYWNAKIVEGMEADDAIGLAMTRDTVIVSTDKDLDTLPGWHYNWVKQELYEVSEDEADVHFWTQMLVGDRADNVLGIPKVGPVSAAKLLSACRTPTDRRDAVLAEYEGYFGHEEAARQFSINSVLLRICRTQKELEDNSKLAEIYGKSLQDAANEAKLNEQDLQRQVDNSEAALEGTGAGGAQGSSPTS